MVAQSFMAALRLKQVRMPLLHSSVQAFSIKAKLHFVTLLASKKSTESLRYYKVSAYASAGLVKRTTSKLFLLRFLTFRTLISKQPNEPVQLLCSLARFSINIKASNCRLLVVAT